MLGADDTYEETPGNVTHHPKPALIEGTLQKRSEWLGSWNERHCSLIPQEASTPAVLMWRGGKQPGHFELTKCVVSVQGKDLIITANAGREVRFRQAAGGLPLDSWYKAISVLGAETGSGGAAVQLDLGTESERFMSVAIP